MSDQKPFIDITISPQGDVVIEAQRYKGAACQDATRPYVNALGLPAVMTAKPEMYQTPDTTTENKTRA